MKYFPWEFGEKPYFINNEGFEWYLDKDMTRYAREIRNEQEGLADVAAFFVKNGEQIERVLINNAQQILHSDTTLEGMAVKIDALRFFKNEIL